jgi:UDP-N-acetylglucosamine--N-acetylmuramyl-(pentapeptide) pyrophosphoryl-undecaprenol N-acetylglucosamine transferase
VRLLLAGGGTGGHIAPALAVAEALERDFPGVEILFAATPRPVDAAMYAAQASRLRILDPPRLDGGMAAKLLLPLRASSALSAAHRVVSGFRPDAVLATGGYSSFFCVLAGWLDGVPVLVHESNAVPGMANRRAARFARKALVGFESASSAFGRKAIFTGNPVRPSLVPVDAGAARASMGLDPAVPVVLVLGGSQGASALNDLALAGAGGEVQIILQCGERDAARVSTRSSGLGSFVVTPFATDPAPLYSAADFCVARAGAMTIAELSRFGLPCILVPYPHAAGDHQTANAAEVERAGGGLLRPEASLDAVALWAEIGSIISDRGRLASMSSAMKAMSPGDPAGLVAKLLVGEAGGSPKS